MKRISVLWVLLCTIYAIGCATNKQGTPVDSSELQPEILRIFRDVQARHAPDPRLAIFRVRPERTGDYLILKGEVENATWKDELIDRLKQVGIKAVDRITVLPAENLGTTNWGIVRISVANVRDERGNGAELGTQVLMGHVIRVWKNEGGWYNVQSADRYLGWTDDDGFIRVTRDQVNAWNESRRLIVTDYEDRVWTQPGGRKSGNSPVTDVVAGCLVKHIGEEGEWYKVELPDGRPGYLAKASAMNYEEWQNTRKATAKSIEESAMSLMGVPYLWGGTSTKAVDCSGFTKTVYFLNGIHLLRNASHQSKLGVDVPLDANYTHLRKGDLLFFGNAGGTRGPERVSHVGIYLEDKRFIHSSGLVKINSLDPKSPVYDAHRHRTLLKVRRYLPEG